MSKVCMSKICFKQWQRCGKWSPLPLPVRQALGSVPRTIISLSEEGSIKPDLEVGLGFPQLGSWWGWCSKWKGNVWAGKGKAWWGSRGLGKHQVSIRALGHFGKTWKVKMDEEFGSRVRSWRVSNFGRRSLDFICGKWGVGSIWKGFNRTGTGSDHASGAILGHRVGKN